MPPGAVVHDTGTMTGAVAGFTPTGLMSFTFTGSALGSERQPGHAVRRQGGVPAPPPVRFFLLFPRRASEERNWAMGQ